MIRQSAAALSVFLMQVSMAFAETAAHGETEAELVHDAMHETAPSGGLPQFDPTWFPSQIFWLAVAFAFLYLFFSRKTLPEISGVIENRRTHIQSDLELADKLTKEAEDVQEAYEESLTSAREQASGALAEADESMKAKAAQVYEDFRKRSETEIRKTEQKLEEAKTVALSEMTNIAAEVVGEAVEKITGMKADNARAKAAVEALNATKEKKAA